MTYLPNEDSQNEEGLESFNYINMSNNINNFDEDIQIGGYDELSVFSTIKHTIEFTAKEDLSKNDNKYTIKISTKNIGKKKKKGKKDKNKVTNFEISNSKNKIKKIDGPSPKKMNKIQQKEFQLLTKIKRKRSLSENDIPGSLGSIKIKHDEKIHSDKQPYRANPVFHMDFKKVKKYFTTEDNEFGRIKNLSTNESKIKKDLDIKTEQVDKNMRIKKIVNSLKVIKILKQTQK